MTTTSSSTRPNLRHPRRNWVDHAASTRVRQHIESFTVYNRASRSLRTPSFNDCQQGGEFASLIHTSGPTTKMVFPKGSVTSKVRPPHSSFLGGRFTGTRVRHSS